MLRSIYQIHNLLFYSGHSSFSFISFFFFFLLRQSPHGEILNCKSLHIEKMIFFNNFRLVLKIGFRDPAISWIEAFLTKIGGFQLLVIVTEDLVLDVGGRSYILCCLLIFVKNCLCFEFLVLKFICV